MNNDNYPVKSSSNVCKYVKFSSDVTNISIKLVPILLCFKSTYKFTNDLNDAIF